MILAAVLFVLCLHQLLTHCLDSEQTPTSQLNILQKIRAATFQPKHKQTAPAQRYWVCLLYLASPVKHLSQLLYTYILLKLIFD